jgi:hypothetical protein
MIQGAEGEAERRTEEVREAAGREAAVEGEGLTSGEWYRAAPALHPRQDS